MLQQQRWQVINMKTLSHYILPSHTSSQLHIQRWPAQTTKSNDAHRQPHNSAQKIFRYKTKRWNHIKACCGISKNSKGVKSASIDTWQSRLSVSSVYRKPTECKPVVEWQKYKMTNIIKSAKYFYKICFQFNHYRSLDLAINLLLSHINYNVNKHVLIFTNGHLNVLKRNINTVFKIFYPVE